MLELQRFNCRRLTDWLVLSFFSAFDQDDNQYLLSAYIDYFLFFVKIEMEEIAFLFELKQESGKMKKFLTLLLVICMVLGFAGCQQKPNEPEKETFEIAIVTDVGQLNDGGFNQGTYEGAKAFAEATGKTYKYYQPANGEAATDADRIAAMEQAVENGAQVIVTPGFLQAAAITDVATKHPEVKFVFVDGWPLGLPNVTAIAYKEHESGYFAGYAAVKDGYTKLGGTFGGGGTNPACERFAYGYVQGANAAAAELGKKVDVTISFQYGGSFSASPELLTQISGWYNNGTEIVFACGGSMVQSVLQAAKENNGKVIGVDVDQANLDACVVTSAVKGLNPSVQLVLKKWSEGKWDAELGDKLQNLGAAEDSTGLPTAAGSWRFATFTQDEYKALFAKVVSGEVTIRDDVAADMSKSEAWDALRAACPAVNLTVE